MYINKSVCLPPHPGRVRHAMPSSQKLPVVEPEDGDDDDDDDDGDDVDADDDDTSTPSGLQPAAMIMAKRSAKLLMCCRVRKWPAGEANAKLCGVCVALLMLTLELFVLSSSHGGAPPPPVPPLPLPSQGPSPALSPLPLAPSPIVWKQHAGLNCSGGGYGAFNVGSYNNMTMFPLSDAPVAGVSSLIGCQHACVQVADYGCEGILFDKSKARCYHRHYIDLNKCARDQELDFYHRTDSRPAFVATPLIVDTDMSFDVDDVGALCMAHALHDLGEASLLAVMHNSGYPQGIGAASVLAHYYGHDDIPLGAYQGEFGKVRDDFPEEGLSHFEPKVCDRAVGM